MTTFTTEDRELVEKEPIPFYGYCHLTDPHPKDSTPLLHPVLKKLNWNIGLMMVARIRKTRH